MENAPAAIYCLSAGDRTPVWANARARSLGTTLDDLPAVDGRPVADLIDSVLRTGRPETVAGSLGPDGPATTVIVRPMRVAGGPGALLLLESDDAPGTSLWPKAPADVVDQAQLHSSAVSRRGPQSRSGAAAAVPADAARRPALRQLPPRDLCAGGRR
jgi:hypothetical protein